MADVLKLLKHHLFFVTVKGCHVDIAAHNRLSEVLGDMLRWKKEDNWLAHASSDTMNCFPRKQSPAIDSNDDSEGSAD